MLHQDCHQGLPKAILAREPVQRLGAFKGGQPATGTVPPQERPPLAEAGPAPLPVPANLIADALRGDECSAFERHTTVLESDSPSVSIPEAHTEETVRIDAFGSLVLAEPLQYIHTLLARLLFRYGNHQQRRQQSQRTHIRWQAQLQVSIGAGHEDTGAEPEESSIKEIGHRPDSRPGLGKSRGVRHQG